MLFRSPGHLERPTRARARARARSHYGHLEPQRRRPLDLRRRHVHCRSLRVARRREQRDLLALEIDLLLTGMAERYGYDVQEVTLHHIYGNVHGVPEHTIQKMRERWEE